MYVSANYYLIYVHHVDLYVCVYYFSLEDFLPLVTNMVNAQAYERTHMHAHTQTYEREL